LTSDTPEGRTVLKLLRNEIAVYSPHTAFDSAATGINQRLAEALGLENIVPLRTIDAAKETVGSGRAGELKQAESLENFLGRVQSALQVSAIGCVGERSRTIQKIGVACGAAGEFLKDAAAAGCDAFVTGETRFHTCLEARDLNVAMILAGHYATERPAVEWLATRIADEFPMMTVWASRAERDPLQWSIL
jgi:dinuclear metal center YbgI/SA1388 family protein